MRTCYVVIARILVPGLGDGLFDRCTACLFPQFIALERTPPLPPTLPHASALQRRDKHRSGPTLTLTLYRDSFMTTVARFSRERDCNDGHVLMTVTTNRNADEDCRLC